MNVSIIGAKLLIILWMIGKDYFFTQKACYALSIIPTIMLLLGPSFSEPLIFIAMLFCYILAIVFSYLKVGKLYLTMIFITVQSIFLTLVTVIGRDIPYWLASKNTAFNDLYVSVYSYLIQIILLFLMLLVFKRYVSNKKIWDLINIDHKSYNIISMILIILNFLITLYREYLVLLNDHIAYIYISFILFFYAIVITVIILFVQKNYQQSLYIRLLSEKAQSNKNENSLLQEFRHDYKAFLIGVKGYLDDEDIEGARKYINELNVYSKEVLQDNNYEKIEKIKEPSIQGLLLYFIDKCKKEKVDLTINISNFPDKIPMDLIEFIRCLSIILDNALEHTTGKIYFSIMANNYSCQITLRNSINEVVQTDDIFKRNYSTKTNHSGIGLTIFSRIMNRYTNVDYHVESNNNWFSFILDLNYEE